jgi:hypothetical protein
MAISPKRNGIQRTLAKNVGVVLISGNADIQRREIVNGRGVTLPIPRLRAGGTAMP